MMNAHFHAMNQGQESFVSAVLNQAQVDALPFEAHGASK